MRRHCTLATWRHPPGAKRLWTGSVSNVGSCPVLLSGSRGEVRRRQQQQTRPKRFVMYTRKLSTFCFSVPYVGSQIGLALLSGVDLGSVSYMHAQTVSRLKLSVLKKATCSNAPPRSSDIIMVDIGQVIQGHDRQHLSSARAPLGATYSSFLKRNAGAALKHA